MKVSLNWLRDYVPLTASPEEIARAITFLGFEVEGIHSTGAPRLDHVVVGEILTRARHPNADKLSVCTVDVGPAGGVKTIVCGAANCDVGHRVLVALPGAVLPGNFAIKASKIRGQASEGMMCSPDELGLPGDHAGLLLLPERPALGLPIQEALPGGDTIFDVEITPNRPDCQCHLGIARELAAWFRLPLTYPQARFRGDVSAAPQRPDLLAGVEVQSPEDCPYYSAHVVTGIKVGPSPAWLQDRLRAVGLRPINNVVDVTNYVMLETGQPLHAFDARRLAGNRIIVRLAGEGECLLTLDGKERKLDARTLVIADAARTVVIAGVMGGEDSGVTAETADLVLECAVFRRQTVRAASRRLGLSTDSSYRYERGVDAHGAPEAAGRAIDLILETAGGTVVGPSFRVGGDVPWSREVVVTHDFITERLGFEVPAAEMRAALEALELRITREEETIQPARGPAWTVAIPSWRDDLDRPIDLVEEVLRLHGTERIPAAAVVSPGLAAEDDPVVRFNRQATDYLVGHDFHECVNYTLRPARELAAWTAAAELPRLALANPFVDDQTHLRSSLIGGLLESLRLNQTRGVPVARLAETGRIFLEREGQVVECVAAAFVVAESSGERSWLRRESADFFNARHHVGALAGLAGLRLGPLAPATAPGWQVGQAALAGDSRRGWWAGAGLVDLALTRSLGVEGRVQAGFLALMPELLPARAGVRRFQDFSLFPAALRDLALIVPEATPAGEVMGRVERASRQAAGPNFAFEGASVFDVYRGPGLPEGHKSIAFNLVFRGKDRTLTDEEVNTAFQRLQDDALAGTTWQIRR
ncbi:MAG: phenylalanine--tRNA ligase subunit beta [Opitutaceae bacterium]